MAKFNFSNFVNSASSPNAFTFITPYNSNLAEGEYKSTVVRVDDSQLELDSGFMDCFMELTDNSNTTVTVRFRVYQGSHLGNWIKIFSGYGCTGALNSMVGVKEKIVVSHGTTYAYISERELIPQCSAKSSLGGRGRTLLGKKRSDSSSTTAEERRRSLLDDSDEEDDIISDDEFDDFLSDEED